ncbi:hypothetical protein ACTFIW_003668 [Dictyostelium discoideum]
MEIKVAHGRLLLNIGTTKLKPTQSIVSRVETRSIIDTKRKIEKYHQISHWLTVLNQWNGKEISLFPSYDYVLTTDASESGAGATLKKGNKIIKTWSFQWSTTQSNMSSNRGQIQNISPVPTTLKTIPQEESQTDYKYYDWYSNMGNTSQLKIANSTTLIIENEKLNKANVEHASYITKLECP